MIKQIQKLVVQMVAGANVATVALMVLAGYSDRINPTDHPLLSVVGMAFPAFLLINLCFLCLWLFFKWRMAAIPVAGFVMAYIPITIYMPLNTTQEVPGDALKIISYNVCSYGGNYKYEQGFEAVRDYLRSEQADIVCLQEDADTWRRYVFRDYAKFLQYNDTVVISDNAASFNAIGIHTRFPIIRRERIDYPSQANGSVAWWLQVGSDTLIVVNNHFESCHLNSTDRQQYRQLLHGELRGDSARAESRLLLVKLAEANEKRARQIRAVASYAEEHRQYPVVVCGDFNDNPISYSRHEMARRLTDCFAATGRGIGLSYSQKAFAFRIDHLFCSEQVQPYNCKIDNKVDASDHYPLVCWLKIGAKP